MSDRELLEAAAMAAGVEGHFCAKKELDTERWGIVTFLGYGQAAFWNPLTDDGDALRLAGKLHITIASWQSAPGYPTGASVATTPDDVNFLETHDGNAMAATRRTIVRAAAALGSGHEGER